MLVKLNWIVCPLIIGYTYASPHNTTTANENASTPSPASFYWKFHTSIIHPDSDAAFGITGRDNITRSRGLFYMANGGLTDGELGGVYYSYTSSNSFGPSLKPGDVLGLFASFEHTNVKVYFDINGVSLGCAYDLPRRSISSDVFPMVQSRTVVSVAIEAVHGRPAGLERSFVYKGYEGHWKLSQVKVNGSVQDYPNDKPFVLFIEAAQESFGTERLTLDIQIAASVRAKLLKRPDPGSNWETEEISKDNPVITQQGIYELEQTIQPLLGNVSSLGFDSSQENFMIITNDNDGIYTKWEKHSLDYKPVTEIPFGLHPKYWCDFESKICS